MDESAAYMMLSKVAQLYISIVEKERAMFITAGSGCVWGVVYAESYWWFVIPI